MQLLRALYDWKFMQNTQIPINNEKIGIMDAISKYLISSEVGRNTELYGYALHVEVVGIKEDRTFEHILTHTHPASDGSVEGWEKLRAYTRCVAIPFSIAAQMISLDQVKSKGVVIPERALQPDEIFNELVKRDIHIHEKVIELGQ
jgi:saccharopine dehydrogenase-like NADP-dependent oxidoreductase